MHQSTNLGQQHTQLTRVEIKMKTARKYQKKGKSRGYNTLSWHQGETPAIVAPWWSRLETLG